MSDELWAATTGYDTPPVVDPTPVGGVRIVRPRRSWPKRIALALLAIVLGLVGYYLVTLYQVWSTGRSDQAQPVDAIVVMGAAQYDGRPSLQLQARLDHVVALWGQGLADTVVVTGGNQPGDRFTEADVSAEYLIERGVPETAILRETVGRSSYGSLEQVAAILQPLGKRSVLIVSDPFHLLRSKLSADELGLTAYVSPTPTTTITGGEELAKELKEAAGVSLGRVIGFDRLLRITG
ncbi:MAG: YdcF family protein [Acidimicrobiales bacterium]